MITVVSVYIARIFKEIQSRWGLRVEARFARFESSRLYCVWNTLQEKVCQTQITNVDRLTEADQLWVMLCSIADHVSIARHCISSTSLAGFFLINTFLNTSTALRSRNSCEATSTGVVVGSSRSKPNANHVITQLSLPILVVWADWCVAFHKVV